MDPNNSIEVRNIVKKFKIAIEDPDKVPGRFNKRSTKTIINNVIDDISFDICKGEVVGILGRNGSGKSTLLSLIAKILEPDSGTIERSGKIASILELGMGFHPDMSGRENIYIKGELYGFTRNQLDTKIDKIIDYSGIRKYIDNPVRTYSSGMSGRLAFSILINVDSEIILVDEVLSVGDAAFSAKAKEHFKRLAKSGKTIIIVSHNTETISEMCNRAIWIENGKLFRDGPAETVCSEYENTMSESPEIISDLALAGVPDSQYKLALMYRDGRYFGQSEELYEEWIKNAAVQGHTRAQVEYADILMKSNNAEEAILYYQYAAKKGDLEAKNKLSSINTLNDDNIEELLNIFYQLSSKGNNLDNYRYANLLLKLAWTNDDRKKAFEAYLLAANNGNIDAMHQVAIMYRDGVGTRKNTEQMEKYFQKAASNGFIPSLIQLADLYTYGKILPKDDTKAFECLLKAAKLGEHNSMFRVANCYSTGCGVTLDTNKAMIWYNRYSKLNYYQHYVWASDCIRSGTINTKLSPQAINKILLDVNNPFIIANNINDDVINNVKQSNAIELMIYKAENNNLDAMRRLGNMYYDGVGTKRDFFKAVNWYEKAASLGDPWVINRLGEMYRDGRGAIRNIETSIKWFTEAAALGNITAISNLINLYLIGLTNDKKIFENGLKMMASNAEAGNFDAMRRLGNMYYDGAGVQKDYSKAIAWYRKLGLFGDAWTKNRLGEMHRDGKGTKVDINAAAKWFIDSALQGNMGSATNLINLYLTGLTNDIKILETGLKIMRSNADAGNIDAIRRLGNMYHDGQGVKRDYFKAAQWYTKLASLGDVWATNRLSEMKRDGRL